MDPLKYLKPAQSQRAITRLKAWNILIHIHSWQNSQQFAWFLLQHLCIVGIFINWMSIMHFYVHGELNEDVYMTMPQGVNCAKPNRVCMLLQSLYGLKQANRKWYKKLTSLLLLHCYKQSTSDHSLFVKTVSSEFTVLLVYVNDIILASSSLFKFDSIKAALDSSFKIKDLKLLKYFLSLEVAHSKKGISLCQRK